VLILASFTGFDSTLLTLFVFKLKFPIMAGQPQNGHIHPLNVALLGYFGAFVFNLTIVLRCGTLRFCIKQG
jgi:hypothetical protein